MLIYVAIFCFVFLAAIGLWYYKEYKGPPSRRDSEEAHGNGSPERFRLLAASGSLTPELKEYLLATDAMEMIPALGKEAGEMSPELLEEIASFLVSTKKWEEILSLMEHADAELRENTCEVLGCLVVPGGAQALVTALGDKNEAVRLAATASLVNLQDAGTAEPLAQALAHPGKLVPARVAEVLLALGEQAVNPLLEAIREADEEGQPLIIEVLGQLEDSKAVPVLTEILQASSVDKSRAAAATALGNLPERGQGSALMEALGDTYWDVRAKAAEALASLRNLEACEALQRVAETDTDWNVQVVAQAALKRLECS